MRKIAFLSGLVLIASSLAFLTPSAEAAAPSAVDDVAEVYTGTSVEIEPLTNDTGGALTITSATDPAHGSVTCTDSLCTYTSTAGYVGEDSFDYTITDGTDTATATVTVTVKANPVTSITLDQPATGVIGTPQQITGTAALASDDPAAGEQFELWSWPTGDPSSTTLLATATAATSGKITFTAIPTSASTTLEIHRAGDDTVRSGTATWAALPQIDKVTMKAARTSTTWPKTVRFTGTVAPKVAGRTVTLQVQPVSSGGWTTVATGRTNGNGVVTVSARPTKLSYYRWAVDNVKSTSSPAIFVKPAVSLSAKKNGKYDLLTARVTPTRKGTPIKLQRKLPGKPWKTVKTTKAAKATATTSLESGYTHSFKVKGSRGKVLYRIWLPPDSWREEVFGAKHAIRR
ncbi:MAG: Ig-like domain-containing protein [Nocardioidaceae bacterium]